MKLTGAKAQLYLDTLGDDMEVITTGSTERNKWYKIIEYGEGSHLPFAGEGAGYPFQAPDGEQITLVQGDRIISLEGERFCKTSASLSLEEGTVEVGDDCDPGATILDGIVKASGSFAGLFRYDDQTGAFNPVTDEIINKFFDIVNDDGNGIYELIKRDNAPVFMMICLNSSAAIGQVENWLCLPIIISSMSTSLGNTDAQNKDLSWSKGEGPSVKYSRIKKA